MSIFFSSKNLRWINCQLKSYLIAIYSHDAEYDIEYLFQEAKRRWLKPAEVLFILQNHEKYELTQEPPQKPAGNLVSFLSNWDNSLTYSHVWFSFMLFYCPYYCLNSSIGGSLYLFNKRVLRFFRKDGHSWRRKKDGRAIAEAHERLKVYSRWPWNFLSWCASRILSFYSKMIGDLLRILSVTSTDSGFVLFESFSRLPCFNLSKCDPR